MRIFKPQIMDRPHWHGHVEVNFIRNARMHYIVDGERIIVEPQRAAVFWAGVPHQLVAVEHVGDLEPELGNIYLPLDAFLFMSHVPGLQVALLTGAMISVPEELMDWRLMLRWYGDYRSGDPLRVDLVKWELNGIFWRLALGPMDILRQSWERAGVNPTQANSLTSVHVRHVVAMVRYVLDNIEQPLRNIDVTQVTGLHTNYALALFSRVMQVPLKQFIIRMRLLRARGLLLESDMAIASVAMDSGFSSMSQFYAHFAVAYGTSPQQLRDRYMVKAELTPA
jgi:AraC-like DNA-binding protein